MVRGQIELGYELYLQFFFLTIAFQWEKKSQFKNKVKKGLKKILIKVNTYSAEQTKYIQTEIVSEFFKFRKYQVMHTYPRSWKQGRLY